MSLETGIGIYTPMYKTDNYWEPTVSIAEKNKFKKLQSVHRTYIYLKIHSNIHWKWKLLSRVQLCDPMDCIVHGILQARILEEVTFHFSRGSSQPRDLTQVSLIAGRFFTHWATREYISGADKYCLIPFIGDTYNTQTHRVRKYTGRCRGLGEEKWGVSV